MFYPKMTVFSVLLLVMGAHTASAENRLPVSCPVTKEVFSSDAEPREFHKTNNLRRDIGSAVTASGVPVFIKGRLTDARCVPIAQAIVELWQVDGDGNSLKHKEEFIGSGTASTDNLGRFEFLTVLPGASKNDGKRVNVRVKHPSYTEFETAAYFGGSSKSGASLIADGDSEFGKVYNLQISLEAKKQYRVY